MFESARYATRSRPSARAASRAGLEIRAIELTAIPRRYAKTFDRVRTFTRSSRFVIVDVPVMQKRPRRRRQNGHFVERRQPRCELERDHLAAPLAIRAEPWRNDRDAAPAHDSIWRRSRSISRSSCISRCADACEAKPISRNASICASLISRWRLKEAIEDPEREVHCLWGDASVIREPPRDLGPRLVEVFRAIEISMHRAISCSASCGDESSSLQRARRRSSTIFRSRRREAAACTRAFRLSKSISGLLARII